MPKIALDRYTKPNFKMMILHCKIELMSLLPLGLLISMLFISSIICMSHLQFPLFLNIKETPYNLKLLNQLTGAYVQCFLIA